MKKFKLDRIFYKSFVICRNLIILRISSSMRVCGEHQSQKIVKKLIKFARKIESYRYQILLKPDSCRLYILRQVLNIWFVLLNSSQQNHLIGNKIQTHIEFFRPILDPSNREGKHSLHVRGVRSQSDLNLYCNLNEGFWIFRFLIYMPTCSFRFIS